MTVPIYRWVKENRRVESLITLKDWTAGKAEHQIQATKIKHGLKSGNTNRKLHDQRSKCYGIDQTDDIKERDIQGLWCKLCSLEL